ncbi:Short-chain dehydrogenase [Flexibacter flexilis DSM 6793]|uniref:Short-chain dehydrogenase n=1 Tax=Flexibacter flexilis DSM 6793 TaxID=927664 RepID=A0A1I1G1K1_9BACT|nr:SDR family oxidoreductase [Flexibacter flexilis]SFC05196.1 Short-chain dehydrogenase [Flexibacter flexilis DSM 6793]
MKIVVVTGGTKGIGRAIVEKFAREGFHVITCARNEIDLVALREEMRLNYGARVSTFAADLSDAAQVEAFGRAVLTYGTPAVWVGNAGIYATGRLTEETPNVLSDLLAVNLLPNYILAQIFAPAMKQAAAGHIFTICSVASYKPIPDAGSYCVSKAALYGFTKVLREELRPHNIKVTAVLPAATLTSSWDDEPNKPTNILQPTDIAESIWAAYSLSAQAVTDEIHLSPL